MQTFATEPHLYGGSPHPSIFLLLNLPFGITTGYITVTIPFLVTKAGLPVATAATIVAIGLAPKAWKMLWAPLADLGLTLKSWYVIGASMAGAMMLLQNAVPLKPATVPVIALVLFAAEFGSGLTGLSQGGLMAVAMPEGLKGQTAGWHEVGGRVGRAIGGGGGLWLAARGSHLIVGPALGVACAVCMVGLSFVQEPIRPSAERPLREILRIGRELWGLVRSPDGAMVSVLAVIPIGISGVENFWTGIAREWRVLPETVALVTGFAGPAVGAAGCLVAGWWADRADRRVVYLATGALLAAVGMFLAIAPHTPQVFIFGTLAQAATTGMCSAALIALIVSVVGRSAAATKVAVLGALGNAPVLYMTVVSGRIHDRWGTITMLLVESVAALVCIGVVALLLKRFGEAAQPQKRSSPRR
jgi:hypothetical protein